MSNHRSRISATARRSPGFLPARANLVEIATRLFNGRLELLLARPVFVRKTLAPADGAQPFARLGFLAHGQRNLRVVHGDFQSAHLVLCALARFTARLPLLKRG